MKKIFLITFKAFDSKNRIIKEGKFKVKNQINEFSAKVNFEMFLTKKYTKFQYLEISECVESFDDDDQLDHLLDIFGMTK